MPYQYVSNSEREEIANFMIELIKKETGKSQSEYSIIMPFEAIGADEIDASLIVMGIEDRYNVIINSSYKPRESDSNSLPCASKKRKGFLEKIASIFVPELLRDALDCDVDSSYAKESKFLSPQDVLKSTFDQIEQRKQQEMEKDAKTLKNLLPPKGS